jgi:hypothetical protein
MGGLALDSVITHRVASHGGLLLNGISVRALVKTSRLRIGVVFKKKMEGAESRPPIQRLLDFMPRREE